jgi:hypothetical protein
MADIWGSPIYRFRIPKNENDEESSKLKEIVIDVTGSAPAFAEPSEALKGVLKEIFTSQEFEKIDTVVEVGAAKLKNIPFILEQGKTVCAVEFKELLENENTKKNIEKCEKYVSKFQPVIFPNPFIADTRKFDLAMLINVPPIMPIFAERLYLLNLLYDKVNDGKYLLWVAQKEGGYKKFRESGRFTCGDGVWRGKGRHFKTFYKYHTVDELNEIMSLYGFKRKKRFNVPDDAILYEKTEPNIFSDMITPEKIRKYIPIEESIKESKSTKRLTFVKETSSIKPIVPNPNELLLENLYIEKIKSITPGIENAEIYHRVVSHAFARIFRESLRNMEIKVPIDNRVKIIDTVFTNYAKDGFFSNLKDTKIDCSHPIIEVKNISDDPDVPDFDQLNGRLTANHGEFGILICRKVDDKDRAYSICKTFLPGRYIIFLTDEDIFEMLGYSIEDNQDEINDLMDGRLRKIIF